jgi:cytochrome b involved in lipid metabolism
MNKIKKVAYLSVFVFSVTLFTGCSSNLSQGSSVNADSKSSSTPTKSISMSELSGHSSRESCWLAIDGSVYDVTSFISNHPGGDRILSGCGKDATALFSSIQGHLTEGKEMLPQFFIGKLS